jgi:hypothetical protein
MLLDVLMLVIQEEIARQTHLQHSIEGRQLMMMKTSNRQEPDLAICSASAEVRRCEL